MWRKLRYPQQPTYYVEPVTDDDFGFASEAACMDFDYTQYENDLIMDFPFPEFAG